MKKRFLNKFSISANIFLISIFIFTIFLTSCSHKKPYFTDDYINKHKNKIIVQIPEVFELANIIVFLSSYSKKVKFAITKNTDYYREVYNYFNKYSNHKLFSKLKLNNYRDYYLFLNNSFRYKFDQKGNILPDNIHSPVWHHDTFSNYIKLIENFAKISNFRKFYNAHINYYNKKIYEYKKNLFLKQQITWLENRFNKKYDSYIIIIISPLTGASHSTWQYSTPKFSEVVCSVTAYPDSNFINKNFKDKNKLLIFNLFHQRRVFTEFDHNFVNPVSRKYIKLINKNFKNIDRSDYNLYNSPYNIFNEYMTWAIFLLYVYDFYPENILKPVEKNVIDFMINHRNFSKFDIFYKKLKLLYINNFISSDNKNIEILFVEILKYMKNQN